MCLFFSVPDSTARDFDICESRDCYEKPRHRFSLLHSMPYIHRLRLSFWIRQVDVAEESRAARHQLLIRLLQHTTRCCGSGACQISRTIGLLKQPDKQKAPSLGWVFSRWTQRYAATEFFQKNFSETAVPLRVKYSRTTLRTCG